MTSLNIILCFICILCIINLYGNNQLIKRELLQATDDPFCGCYTISLTNIANTNKHKEMCYTYSIKHNDTMDICRHNTASNILLGICDHERPRFKPKKLQKSIISINPEKYNAISHRSPHSVLSVKIENDCDSFTNEQFTLCMKNINKLGITSNNVQYTLYDDNIVTCSYRPNQMGLPCRSNTAPPKTQPLSSKVFQKKKKTAQSIDSDDTIPSSVDNGGKTLKPTGNPTITPTTYPTNKPSDPPTIKPTEIPTEASTVQPSSYPTTIPTVPPSTDKPTDSPTYYPTIPTLKPTINPSLQPRLKPTTSRSQPPSSNHPSSFAPTPFPTNDPTKYYIDPDAPKRDICVVFDQSCGFADIECDIYLYWITQFIIRLHDGFINPRLCLLGVSNGIQVFIDIMKHKSVAKIIEILREQQCGNTDTNLLDALEFAQFEFDLIHPRGETQSMVIFNSCSSTDSYGYNNEDEICDVFNTVHTDIDFYVINIQSMNESLVGRTDLDPNTYLNCLLHDDIDRIVSITPHNYRNALQMIGNISNQIINRKPNDADIGTVDAKFVKALGDNHMMKHQLTAFSDSTRNVIEWIFIATLAGILLNALCCTFCALRQSGALDTCFGEIDKGTYDDDGCYVDNTNVSSQYEEREDSSDITHITDNDSVRMSFDDSDRTLNMLHYLDSLIDDDDDDIETPPIPGSVESLVDDIKLKEYLKMKQSRNFPNLINVELDFNVKPIIYNQ